MANTDSEDRKKLTDLAYQYEALQNELNSTIEQWTEANEALDQLPKDV